MMNRLSVILLLCVVVATLFFVTIVDSSECNPGTVASYNLVNSAGQDINPLRCMYGVGNVGQAVFSSVLLAPYDGIYGLAPNLIHLPWGTGEHCGECYELSGPLGRVLGVVMDTTTQEYKSPVTVYTESDGYIHFDVIQKSGNAADVIASNAWEVTWHQVPCPFVGNIKYTITGSPSQTLFLYFSDFLDAIHTVEICVGTVCNQGVRYGIRFYWYAPFGSKSSVTVKVTSVSGQVVTGTLTLDQAKVQNVVYELKSNFKTSVVVNGLPCTPHVDTEPCFSDGAFGKDFAGGYGWSGDGPTIGSCDASTNCLVLTYPAQPMITHYYAPIYAKWYTGITITAYSDVNLDVPIGLNWDTSLGVVKTSFTAGAYKTVTIPFSTRASSTSFGVTSATVISQIFSQNSDAKGHLYIKSISLEVSSAGAAEFNAHIVDVTPWKVNSVQASIADATTSTSSNSTPMNQTEVLGLIIGCVLAGVVIVVLLVVFVIKKRKSQEIV